MPMRTQIRPSHETAHEAEEGDVEAQDPPKTGLIRRLMSPSDQGKSFVWVWPLVAAVLVALSLATLFSRGRPNGLDFHFNWSG